MKPVAARSIQGMASRLVGAWLKSQVTGEELVTVSWGSETAVVVPWLLFTEYWGDFCYPGSDDAII